MVLSAKKQFLIEELNYLYKKLTKRYYETQNPSFYFKAEGIRGCLVALRNNKTIREAVNNSNRFLSEHVALWNKKQNPKPKFKVMDYAAFVEGKMTTARNVYKERKEK